MSKPDVITLLDEGKEPWMVVREGIGRHHPGEWGLSRHGKIITVGNSQVCQGRDIPLRFTDHSSKACRGKA